MSSLVEVLEDIPDSSVFGCDADATFSKLKGVDSIHKLIAIDIPAADVLLRNINATILSLGKRRPGVLLNAVMQIPAVAVQEDFI